MGLIDKYVARDCDLDTSIREAYVKGVKRGLSSSRGWTAVDRKKPKPETKVLITYETDLGTGVTVAIYEDGTVHMEDSCYIWDDTIRENAEYDELTDDYVVPEGWWEDGVYNERIEGISDEVTAWMPLPKPYEGSE